jgi:hypothetical protein
LASGGFGTDGWDKRNLENKKARLGGVGLGVGIAGCLSAALSKRMTIVAKPTHASVRV